MRWDTLDFDDTNTLKIILILFFAALIVITIYSLCYLTILPKCPETDKNSAIFDFYQFMTEDYTSSSNVKEKKVVYFIGSSQIASGLDTFIIEDDLKASKVEAKVYNLGISGDTPLRRLSEMNSLIDSHPDYVIIGITYFGFHEDSIQDFSKYSTSDTYSKLDDYSKSLYREYNKKEAFSLFNNIYSFFGQGQKMINYFFYGPKNQKNSEYLFKSKFGPDLSPEFLKEKREETTRKLNPEKGTDAEQKLFEYTIVTDVNNSDKKAFCYFVQKLKENNISVIIVKMPLNPMILEKIPNSTRTNYFNVINNTVKIDGAVHYDFEKSLIEEDFIDIAHFNTQQGTKKFSHDMAQVILSEMEKE